MPAMLWDVFCKVIDNHGDLGVCWRLAANLGARGEQVRLWVDDASALSWMAPAGAPGVQALPWSVTTIWPAPGDVLLEAFGCEPAPELVAAYAQRAHRAGTTFAWINLEYLTAEPFAERNHRLPSPVMHGPGTGMTKHFFYPGFTPRTGGLLRERDLASRRGRFDRHAWLASHGLPDDGRMLVSLFCYEPPALDGLLLRLAADTVPCRLLVTAGRATDAVHAAMARLTAHTPGWNAAAALDVRFLALMPQEAFDELLWACDLNLVRGEDSLARALLAGRPFLWQLYPQEDDAHLHKLEAFLGLFGPVSSWAAWMRVWNGSAVAPAMAPEPGAWRAGAAALSERLWAQDDLATQLLRHVTKKR